MCQHPPLQGGAAALQSPATCRTPTKSGRKAGEQRKVNRTAACPSLSAIVHTLGKVRTPAAPDQSPGVPAGWWEDPAISTASQAFEIFDASLEKHRHLSGSCTHALLSHDR